MTVITGVLLQIGAVAMSPTSIRTNALRYGTDYFCWADLERMVSELAFIASPYRRTLVHRRRGSRGAHNLHTSHGHRTSTYDLDK